MRDLYCSVDRPDKTGYLMQLLKYESLLSHCLFHATYVYLTRVWRLHAIVKFTLHKCNLRRTDS